LSAIASATQPPVIEAVAVDPDRPLAEFLQIRHRP
jgi:hypothetical protein